MVPFRASCSIPNPVEAFPCGSKSITNTLRPTSARQAPRLTAVVLFPTPPFWFAMAITRAPSVTQLPSASCPTPHASSSAATPPIGSIASSPSPSSPAPSATASSGAWSVTRWSTCSIAAGASTGAGAAGPFGASSGGIPGAEGGEKDVLDWRPASCASSGEGGVCSASFCRKNLKFRP